MKNFIRIVLIFLLIILTILLFYILLVPNSSTTQIEEDLVRINDVNCKKENVYDVVNYETKFLNSETEYIIIKNDIISEKESEYIQKIPEKYIGMDRENFISSLESFQLSPPLKELEQGFVGLEILSFSPQRVVIRHDYVSTSDKDFYICVRNHYLIVYLSDKKTLFMYTDIKLDYLPQNVQQNVIQGLYMQNEELLYDFLESYSS